MYDRSFIRRVARLIPQGAIEERSRDESRRLGGGPAAALEDLHELQQLRAHYCQHLDSGRWDDLVDLFTPDGAFVGLSTARGHANLRSFFSELQAGALSAWWHFSSNETLEVDGDRAAGQTWLLQP